MVHNERRAVVWKAEACVVIFFTLLIIFFDFDEEVRGIIVI